MSFDYTLRIFEVRYYLSVSIDHGIEVPVEKSLDNTKGHHLVDERYFTSIHRPNQGQNVAALLLYLGSNIPRLTASVLALSLLVASSPNHCACAS